MSSVSSAKIGLILKNINLSASQMAKILQHLNLYRKGHWIYPGTLKRELNISIEEAYKILETLSDAGFLEAWYEVRCGKCQNPLLLVRNFNELPDVIECDSCDSAMNTLDNTIKVYKVL